MPHESANPRIAIVGASSLRGKELQQFIEDENLPFSEISLIDTSLPAGTLAEVAGEPTFLKPMDRESFEGVRFVFFCGSAQEAKSNWKLAADAGATIIDLTGALEDSGAAPWIPGLDTLLAPPEAKAEREQLGIDELEKQTADLLLLRPISQSVFDAQVAFNLLSSYGEASKPALSETRAEICKRVAAYLCGRVPAPAVQLIQAPVFYGYGFSVYVDVSGSVDPAAIDTALFGAGIHVTQKGDPAPTNVSVAGEAKIHVAHAERDPDVSSGVWLWGVADNLRLAAANAVQIAKELLAPKI